MAALSTTSKPNGAMSPTVSAYSIASGQKEVSIQNPMLASSNVSATAPIIVAHQPVVKAQDGSHIVVPTSSHPHRVEKYAHRQRKIGQEVHNQFKKPQEIFASAVNLGVYKAEMRWDKTFVLGMLAGAYIALAGCICIIFGGGVPTIKHDDPGLQKFLFACIFPFGIMLVVIAGGELVTSNMAVMPSALLARRIKFWQLLRNWFFAYFGNLCGSLFVAAVLIHATDLTTASPWAEFLSALVVKKTTGTGWGQQVARGIGCNWLVCLGFWASLAAEDIIGKIWALWFPITAFVVIGFEHSVMNMFLIPAGIMTGAPLSTGDFIAYNLIPVTIGNIIGGLLVALPYYYVYWLPDHPLGVAKMLGLQKDDPKTDSKSAADRDVEAGASDMDGGASTYRADMMSPNDAAPATPASQPSQSGH